MDKTILLVDDEPWYRNMLRDLFEFDDWKVFDVATVNAAIVHLNNHKIDLLFTDNLLGGLKGIDLIKILRAKDNDLILETRRDIPVILNTASTLIENEYLDRICKELDAVFLEKTTNLKDMLKICNDTLKKHIKQ